MTWAHLVADSRGLPATYDDADPVGSEPGGRGRTDAGRRAAGPPAPAAVLRGTALAVGPMAPGIALGVAAAAVLGLTATVVIIGLQSPIVDRPAVFVTLRAVFCVTLLGIALVMAARGASARMAGLLVATAALAALTGLTQADAGLPFTVGRIAAAVWPLIIASVCLAYPTGRIEDHVARRVIGVAATVTFVLMAANLLLSVVPPVAGPFVRCSGAECPANPLHVVALGPTTARVLSTSLALATALMMAATAWVIGRRARQATRLQRRSLAPLLAWAVVAAAAYGFFITVRAFDDHAPVLDALAVTVAAIIAVMPFALAAGIVRGRLFAMMAVERIVADLEAEVSLRGIQQTLSRAFGDPRLRVLRWREPDSGYVDVDGRQVDVAAIGPDRRVGRVGHGGEAMAAIVHDPLLPPDVIETACSAVWMALENARLQMTLSASIRALQASRQRVARAADEERRRIEQDLHDGAQQGLIALRIRLQMLEDLVTRDPQAVAPALRDAGQRVQAALDDIRDLAHGIYPSALTDLGLAYALADVTRTLPVHVVLHTELPRRVTADVETAVYFCCVEALQNVAKHCRAGARADLSLYERGNCLRFTLRDSGPGFDPARVAGSHGIAGMRDRLEAVGGRLTIRSSPERGTQVTGSVPLTP